MNPSSDATAGSETLARRETLQDTLSRACAQGDPAAILAAARDLRGLIEQADSSDGELARVAMIEGTAALETRQADAALEPLGIATRFTRSACERDPADSGLRHLETLLMLARAQLAARAGNAAAETIAEADGLAGRLDPATPAHLMPLVQLRTLKAARAVGTPGESEELNSAISLLGTHADPSAPATILMTLQYSLRLAEITAAQGERERATDVLDRCDTLVAALAGTPVPPAQVEMMRGAVAKRRAELGHVHHAGCGHDHDHAHAEPTHGG